MRKFLHIVFSLWLASLLLFGSTPKELLHAFAAHKDTIHRHDSKGQVLDAAHHHCSFTGFHLMPFSAPPALPLPQRMATPVYISFFAVQDLRALQQVLALREGRGPPACV